MQSSKTIQFGERSFDIPVFFCAPPLCVASLLKQLLDEQSKLDSDFLFTWPFTLGASPVTYYDALVQLKTWVSAACITKDVGFHSL